jgi:opacity protein-like surface antigen
MKTFLLIAFVALIPCRSFAQAPDVASAAAVRPQDVAASAALATRTGHEVSLSAGSYTYTEPGALAISIHGAKVAGEYTGTVSVGERQHWLVVANVRGSLGTVAYDGWCSPWLIRPNSISPNGFELGLGHASACNETGDMDWYTDGRLLVGRDFVGRTWGLSPYAGLGLRYLSNGTTGVSGYRTDRYLYPPFGVTARTRVSQRVLSLNLEYDRLIHGWQRTRDSVLGGGAVPPTATAPGFSIDGLSDISFSQRRGWAFRAGAKYQVTSRWSVEPYYVHWSVSASAVNYGTATFTVNGVTAQEQLGAYEPWNATNESGVKLGLHF